MRKPRPGESLERAKESPTLEQGVERVAQLRAEGLSLKDAARQAAKETGLPKNELYGRAMNKKTLLC